MTYQPRRKFADLKAEVIQRSARESPHAIALALGICRATAYKWVGKSRNTPTRIYAEEVREEVRELMLERLTNRQIVWLTGVNIATVKKWRRQWGLTGLAAELNPRTYPPALKAAILDRVERGDQMIDLERRTGIRHETISRWWVKSGRKRARDSAVTAKVTTGG